jgi:hypothetical protein
MKTDSKICLISLFITVLSFLLVNIDNETIQIISIAAGVIFGNIVWIAYYYIDKRWDKEIKEKKKDDTYEEYHPDCYRYNYHRDRQEGIPDYDDYDNYASDVIEHGFGMYD